MELDEGNYEAHCSIVKKIFHYPTKPGEAQVLRRVADGFAAPIAACGGLDAVSKVRATSEPSKTASVLYWRANVIAETHLNLKSETVPELRGWVGEDRGVDEPVEASLSGVDSELLATASYSGVESERLISNKTLIAGYDYDSGADGDEDESDGEDEFDDDGENSEPEPAGYPSDDGEDYYPDEGEQGYTPIERLEMCSPRPMCLAT
ncbi:hypothetical protein TI39_contig4317g00003 [Zymoseptoria brevis]|uniref:Transcription factor Iwr1 domain-containing protein n=1 Tax=Zymoseptoria brevis TaxID=1047168 RepID=A0A0F4G7V5_9PEZI|nr:hypothetical protein TI39_contig4317g00003 [Zymoseptoria brevis]